MFPIGRERRVILVEDERIIALSEGYMLTQAGFRVVIAESAAETLRIIEDGDFSPGLILIDADLNEEWGGLVAAHEISARLGRAPLVFLSADPSWEFVERAVSVSGRGYVIGRTDDSAMLSCISMAYELLGDANHAA
jgi:FOG: CheY-like receiver